MRVEHFRYALFSIRHPRKDIKTQECKIHFQLVAITLDGIDLVSSQ